MNLLRGRLLVTPASRQIRFSAIKSWGWISDFEDITTCRGQNDELDGAKDVQTSQVSYECPTSESFFICWKFRSLARLSKKYQFYSTKFNNQAVPKRKWAPWTRSCFKKRWRALKGWYLGQVCNVSAASIKNRKVTKLNYYSIFFAKWSGN